MRSTFLGVLLLTLSGTSAAFATTLLTCVANVSVAPSVRTEGLVELTGDITLQCTGSAPAAGITGDIVVFLNTAVTSKLLGGSSEALLLVDEPPPGSQTLGTNEFEGTVSSNSVTFKSVPFADPPGGMNLSRVFRITNVRANASGLTGVGAIPVVASVSTANTTGPVVLQNATLNVAFAQTSTTFTVQCAEPGSPVKLLFAEVFATAFKPQGGTDQNMPGSIYNTESGFTPDPLVVGVGTADTGTELGAALSGIPPGVQLTVPASITAGMLTIVAVNPAGGGTVPVVGGTATIVYEVTAADPNQTNEIAIPVTVSHLPTKGAIVRGNLYPISTAAMASATEPIPRFVDVSTDLPFGVTCTGAPALSRWPLVGLALGLLGMGLVVTRRLSRQ